MLELRKLIKCASRFIFLVTGQERKRKMIFCCFGGDFSEMSQMLYIVIMKS